MHKKYYYLPLYISFILMILYCLFGNNFFNIKENIHGEAHNGEINLSSLEYSDSLLISLGGEWKNATDNSSLINITDFFSDNSTSGKAVSLKITLPASQRYYSLIFPRINSEYIILINGEKIYQSSPNTITANIDCTRLISFFAQNKEMELTIIPYSHYEYTMPVGSILIGSESAAKYYFSKILSSDVLLATLVLCAVVYFLILSFSERKSHIYLAFSLLCMVCALRIVLMNNVLLGHIIPNLSNSAFINVLTEIPALLILLIIIYNAELFPEYVPWNIYKITFALIIGYIITAQIIPYKYSLILFVYYILLLLLCFIIIFNILVLLIKNRDQSALAYLLNAIILLLSTLWDTKNPSSFMFMGEALNVGFVFFSINQTIIFLTKSSVAYEEDLALSESYNNSINTLENEETNFLSSHLKPHFLFNALNIISGYALFEPDTASKITAALTIYLKQLFEHDTMNEMNTLQNEIDLVKAFGYIESERFPNIEFIYDIPGNVPEIKTPSLILQPLLENAVNHGIRKKPAGFNGQIIISVRPTRYYIEFYIKDNGVGMSKDQIEKVFQQPEDSKYHSLYYLHSKIKELYNENLIIRSVTGTGTIITFKIPVDK